MRFAHKASIKSGISKTQLLKKLAKVEQSHMHFTGTGRERESQEPARSHHCSDGGGWGQTHLKGIPLRKQCFPNTRAPQGHGGNCFLMTVLIALAKAPTMDRAIRWAGAKVAEQHTCLHCSLLLSEEEMSPVV